MSESPMAAGEAFLPQQVPIDAYGGGGFRFGDMSHRGSLLCLPGGMSDWPVSNASTLNVLDFGEVLAVADRLEVLLVGTGEAQVFLATELKDALGRAGLVAEPMATGAAARTYNVLLAESRAVGAALIAVG